MRRRETGWLLVLVLALAPVAGCGAPSPSGGAVTTGSLYAEMVDMAGLVEFPDPAYKTIQFSSYDRRSVLPEGPDWFANSDGFGGEPIPGFEAVLREPDEDGVGEFLMADVEGPGALVRTWTAAIEGSVKLWLDGASEPVFDGSADDFFHRYLDAFPQSASFDRDLLERSLYQRDAVYAPIPFAQRFRLVWTGNLEDVHFYQLEVRKYAPGTVVETFEPDDLDTYRDTISRVIAVLADPDTELALGPDVRTVPVASEIAAGESVEALVLEGPAAVHAMELSLDADDVDRALRQMILSISFDGHPWGQVQAPLGDFFGAAPGVNPYQSLPFTVRPDGTMVSRYVMPFERSMRIRLDNHGDQPVAVSGSVMPMPYEWDPDRSMYFRARWRADHELIADPAAVQDLPFLVAHGQGVYVGTTSILMNPNPIPTSWGNWWGEGDEKVFVDGDDQPSLFGTGSEDYYNYSWSSPDIFYYPYCGQPRNDGPGNRGFVTNYRWHVLDPLPFEEGIGFYMELYSHERTPGVSYARIGYHYGRPGMIDDHLAVMPEDLRELLMPDGWMPEGRFGANDAVFHMAEEVLEGARLPAASGRLYAGGGLPIWRPRTPGDSLRFRLPVDEDGEYRVHFVARLDPQGGKLQLRWDGDGVAMRSGDSRIDLYRPHRTLLRNFTLEPMQLTAGAHTLELIYDGAADGVEMPEVGVDFIWLQKIEQ